MNLIASNATTVIAGIGVTGLSVARYLARRGQPFVLVDSRAAPPAWNEACAAFPDQVLASDHFGAELFCSAGKLVVSPGLSLVRDDIQAAVAAGVPVLGDIELFAREAQAPIVAITGSNGKSTVTTLLGEMARSAGRRVAVGGNLGTPALDLLADDVDLYVLELSSFQLETCLELGAAVACVLNVSPDHMDRYATLQDYHRAKHRIFRKVGKVVFNRDDVLSRPLLSDDVPRWSFGLDRADVHGYGVAEQDGAQWLWREFTPLLPLAEMGLRGRHNVANGLAALALGEQLGLPLAPMLDALRSFRGLPHRCELIADRDGVAWINDSKGTNVGATLAAVEGLGADHNLILIAGGQGKGADFSPLAPAVARHVRELVLLGEDAEAVATALHAVATPHFVTDLNAAVQRAHQLARPGDTVLLSPACASLDMFADFEDRGRQFTRAVEALSR